MKIGVKGLTLNERKTFFLHLSYSFFEGIILGVFTLNEFVFITTMMGSDVLMSYLFAFSMGVFVFLIFFNEFLRRSHNKRRLLRVTALLSRLPMFVILFFPQFSDPYVNQIGYHLVFLGCFLIYYMGTVIIYPTINLLLKNAYRHDHFGKLYAWSTSLNKLVMLISGIAYGALLDATPFIYVYAYPAVAVMGILGISLLSLIPYKLLATPVIKRTFFQSIGDSIHRMLDILRSNKPYLHFEIGFILYGFAFMTTYGVIQIYFDEVLHLNKTSVAFYRNIYYVITILLLPLFGKLIGKIDPRKFATITFGSMLMFLLFLTLTEYVKGSFVVFNITVYYMMIPYILFHALFAATMGILWNIGSAYFCKNEDAGDYQSVHLSLTGVRAWIAPLAGIYIYHYAGFTFTFSLAMAFLLAGIIYMLSSYRRHKIM